MTARIAGPSLIELKEGDPAPVTDGCAGATAHTGEACKAKANLLIRGPSQAICQPERAG